MQTSYSQNMTAGAYGLIYDTGYNDFWSALSEEAIPFGRLVSIGADIDHCQLPDNAAAVSKAGATRALGIAVRDASKLSGADATTGLAGYPIKDTVSIMRRGRVWVQPEGAWTIGSKVFVRHTLGDSTTALGTFLASDGEGTTKQRNTIAVTSAPAAGVQYGFVLNGINVEVTADATPTQTEVKDAFVTAINAIPELSAHVSASSASASTFTVTSLSASETFTLEGITDVMITNTATTANVGGAAELVGAKFMNAGDAADGDIALIEFDLL